MSEQIDFFSSFAKTKIEDEYAYISYCISNPEQIHFVSKDIFQNESCIKIYEAIEKINQQNLAIELNLLVEISSVPKREIKNIVDQYNDFSNIENITLKRLKEVSVKRSLCKDLDSIVQKGVSSDFQIKHITEIC